MTVSLQPEKFDLKHHLTVSGPVQVLELELPLSQRGAQHTLNSRSLTNRLRETA